MPKRLVLFDIDGTLIHGGKLWRESYYLALRECIQLKRSYPPELPWLSFNGKTDPQICREVLSLVGYSEVEADQMAFPILERYLQNVESEISAGAPHDVEVLPGVRPLLDELSATSEVVLGLLTGNVRRGSDLKLKIAGLHHYFVSGAWGDDHWNRAELPQIALERVQKTLGHEFKGKEIVIVGDTIHDVNCGKHLGVRSIAVGTGRKVDQAELVAQKPDYYFATLEPTAEVVTAILGEL